MAMVILAIWLSETKVRTILYIFGWTIGIAVIAGVCS